MGGTREPHEKIVNYIPYIESKNLKSGIIIKLLIDSGANKNLLRPGIIKTNMKTKSSQINNINGSIIIEKEGKANLIGFGLPLQNYHEIKFHKFFDGLIGAEFMAQTKAKLDFENETVSFENITVPFVKYHPLDYVYHHIITISTLSNGDWFIPCHLKLSDGIIIEPGLYNSTNKKSVIKIMSKSSSKPDN